MNKKKKNVTEFPVIFYRLFGFCAISGQICKKNHMKKRLEKDFILVCNRIADDSVLRDAVLSFEDLCYDLNSSLAALHNVFYETFGMAGDEMLEEFRKERRLNGCKITRWFY